MERDRLHQHGLALSLSMSARDLVLAGGPLDANGMNVAFSPCDFFTGALDGQGVSHRVALFGIPLAWRTKELVQRVVKLLGVFVSMFEIADGENFPPLSVSLWTNRDTSFPEHIDVNFGGWPSSVKVVEETASFPHSFAEVARGGSSGGGGDKARSSDRNRPMTRGPILVERPSVPSPILVSTN
ncbi:hypothetical protein QJS10_CPA16g00848 [Acorus calamus]|uniref:Uncharacterized protein n=1 Tax=Acorus calamus TaxID=4465 RepID=A0AAV9D367_ACOCL|nr:hypothetical protein QJS10_CPA16g00848 [Acorus calamus]